MRRMVTTVKEPTETQVANSFDTWLSSNRIRVSSREDADGFIYRVRVGYGVRLVTLMTETVLGVLSVSVRVFIAFFSHN